MARGIFITFEGGEGSGKSTQIRRVADALRAYGDIAVTREPGGTKGAEALRYILLDACHYAFTPMLEAVLFAAARRDHIEQVIAPALKAGKTVLCDRFYDSTRVYQGLEGKISSPVIDILNQIAVEPYYPDLSIFLDIDAKTGMARADKRRGADKQTDRFEKDGLRIQDQRRRAFLQIARAEPERCYIVNADRPPEIITEDILSIIAAKMKLNSGRGQ